MTDHSDTHQTHGFEDHHHVKSSQPVKLDPNHKVSKEVKDGVWDIIQGKVKPSEIVAPEDRDRDMVEVPMHYVGAVAFAAVKELRRQVGSNAAFSVKRDPDAPLVEIRWDRPNSLVLPEGFAKCYDQKTNCLPAFIANRDPLHVGVEAADLFLRKLAEAEGRN